ncbi:hypothetical protein [Anthocerotibacter panamensis]|uniref:hypothetical protein n=1 Tax=Anthocerotibacter panamensis TaxID=2857077 RepID=UPI001C407C37|nr:hypothetical protein [Anthocerotibacter panamensis]
MVAELSSIERTDYVVVGIAACQRRNAEGKAEPIYVLEPIPATALEAMTIGLRTSFLKVLATTYGALLVEHQLVVPPELSREDLEIGQDFVERINAATRTYKAKPHLRSLPMGIVCTPDTLTPLQLNYADEIKRLFGIKHVVSDSDNVKQHAHTHKVL